ncbi:hypothetical protein [Streptomyces chrestomyceticus]|uniref:hypothetical protein n=1 Tax=Streptomyces chrestomyceticus TaxID=68185 RepID=UPI0037A24D7E
MITAMGDHFERLLSRTTQAADTLGQPELPIAEIMRAEADRARALAAAARPTDSDLGLSADRILHLLGRTKFASRQERDAETLATLILGRASRNEARPTSNKATSVLARLNDTFGHPARR